LVLARLIEIGLSKGVATGNFSKIQKLPQTNPNILKIVEKTSFHQR
jgi:hypothetical protein